MTSDVARVVVGAEATVRDAIAAIDAGGAGIALVVGDGRLLGVITDGDVRRALLAGTALSDSAAAIATGSPITVDTSTARANVLDLMRARRLSAVPVVDGAGRLRGMHTLSDIVGGRVLPNVAVIMAGGRGSRLGRVTESTPKPLVPVAGRPIIEWAVLELVGSGIRTVYVSVGYLADRIVNHLGDGSALGCRIEYLREDPAHPLGTAGALALLAERRPELSEPVIVLNGDVLTRLDAADLVRVHRAQRAALTIGTRTYSHQVPYGVVSAEDGEVRDIAEKPTVTFEVNAGVYAVQPELLALVPRGMPSTMPELAERCLAEDRPVRTWSLTADWIDVGTPQDLESARRGR